MLRAAALLFALALALPASGVAASAPAIPPGAEGAPAVLETSPRHGEWVNIPLDGEPTSTPLSAYVVYPERKDKAPVVIVIQEVYGLTPWLRAVADRLAADGFIAIAPDYLSGMGPGGGGTDSVASRDEVVKLTRSLTPEEVVRRTNAARAYGVALPAATGKVGTVGFCWGGGRSFAYAAQSPPPDAAVVYYGTSPATESLARVRAPVLGLYGGDDARVNATVPAAEAELKRLGKTFAVETYAGAGHGFLRQQEGREANRAAAEKAWPRTIEFLRQALAPRTSSTGAAFALEAVFEPATSGDDCHDVCATPVDVAGR